MFDAVFVTLFSPDSNLEFFALHQIPRENKNFQNEINIPTILIITKRFKQMHYNR